MSEKILFEGKRRSRTPIYAQVDDSRQLQLTENILNESIKPDTASLQKVNKYLDLFNRKSLQSKS